MKYQSSSFALPYTTASSISIMTPTTAYEQISVLDLALFARPNRRPIHFVSSFIPNSTVKSNPH